ncbi:MAG: thioredoxin domain-containing protein [Gammaproteobacteria bacterium]|nr:thioredoxin domain-containing protein [Gammaproteobacteria bacterium]
MTEQTNHLAGETSPYLLQHAHNPVDWYGWDSEALATARELNKPILLSIGYSACHWCHVMAHESFEDPKTAEVMNRLFINIKVDREERPDLDKIYQNAHQLLTQRGGGWPLTVFLTPDDQTPFFAGTYFPPERRHGMPSFVEILEHIASVYEQHEADIRSQNQHLLEALDSLNPGQSSEPDQLNPTPLDGALQQLAQNYDASWGGFGQAPKFPHPTNLERLLRHWAATANREQADNQARDMLLTTLHAMASGGIYDQLGGGFCRYSVDEKWMIPHFEKMLYDNGPLLTLYSQAWQASGHSVFKRIAEETAEWVMREMQAPNGGYYATLDADSEGEEGRFYVWTPQEMEALLTTDEYAVASRIYGLDGPANFEGRWHLHVYQDIVPVAETLKLTPEQATARLQSARQKLFTQREQRIRPGRDEKVLTAWNGLMIKGMAAAGRRLDRRDFIESAQQAVDFIHTQLFQDGRLLASYKDGRARLTAYLDDHVFLLDGLLELLQAEWRTRDLQFAMQLAELLLEQFEDKAHGGFFFTANDHEQLIHRPKPSMDDALPAGNGIAALALARLGHLLGETRFLKAAERTLQNSWQAMSQMPYVHCALLDALEEYLYPPEIIVMRGDKEKLAAGWQACQQGYTARRLCFAIPNNATNLPGLLAERKATDDFITYHCSGTACQPPINSLEELKTILSTNQPGA